MRPHPVHLALLCRPIKVLKVAVSFFFEIFYISTLGIFVVSLDCTYYNPLKVNEVSQLAQAASGMLLLSARHPHAARVLAYP